MTKLLPFLAAFFGAVALITSFAVGTAPPLKNSVSLSWDYDTNNAPDVFKLYTSTDITTPTTNWTLVATVSGNIHNATISNIPAQQAFYYVTASNWWGESNPSNIAGTPQIPGAVSNLQMTLK